jgi:hypothetical protein
VLLYPVQNGQPANILASGSGEEHIKVYAVFTRSYLVQANGARRGKGGTKKIIEIVVLVVMVVVVLALCLGISFRW